MEPQKCLTLPSLIMQIPSLRGIKVRELSSPSQDSLYSTLPNIIDEDTPLDPFYIMDLGMLVTLYHSWVHHLPSIKPFFPVRCNPDQTLLSVLSNLGACFDCSSRSEIARVLNSGVSPDRIMFSNPCKSEDHIKYAASVGVKTLVFDSIEELEKIRKYHSRCSLLLHIDVSQASGGEGASHSHSGSGAKKCGSLPHEVIPLLKHAQRLGLDIIGISLEPEECGSRTMTSTAAVEVVSNAFKAFTPNGLPIPRVINVGGGFNWSTAFAKEAATIRQTFQAKFPNIAVIATPGRFLAEAAFMLVTNVIGKRVRGDTKEYWINDGVYGSMNSVIYHRKSIHAVAFAWTSNRANPLCKGLPTFRSTVFGPTCDALDTVFTDRQLPELHVGDWVVFPNMGAYAHASATNFNGFSATSIHTKFVFSKPSLPTKV
ncbi:hypothetical protein HHK36_004667 [Tetracentron sinense]|uniref:Ornithine decarboxylase n=1 Tax=Tetracentron sinense TaxID=13715 RepID=A0A835DQ42_TETSI|nr:hypothetical protein HHK36_004667 [Tetracentron sinense]